jgi:hypothetical protein
LIAYAKANPGKINMATAGKGTPLDVAGELFKMMAGVEVVSVTYQGESPAIPDLLSGQMQIMFGVLARLYQERQIAGARRDDGGAAGDLTRRADNGRVAAGFRGGRLVWHRGAEKYAA